MLYVARNGALTIVDRDLNVASQVFVVRQRRRRVSFSGRLTVITQSGYGSWYGPMVRLAGPGACRTGGEIPRQP